MVKSTHVAGWATLLCFTFLNVVNYIGLYRARYAHTSSPVHSHIYSFVDDDYPSQLPYDIALAGMSIETTHRFGLIADDDWASIFPEPGDGFVYLGPKGRLFSVSMYHQLHCLDALRVAMAEARSVKLGTDFHHHDHPDPNRSSGQDAFNHADHCFNFLRQALLCAADLTLEPVAFDKDDDGSLIVGADGIGVVHQCKDWTEVRNILEENHREWSNKFNVSDFLSPE